MYIVCSNQPAGPAYSPNITNPRTQPTNHPALNFPTNHFMSAGNGNQDNTLSSLVMVGRLAGWPVGCTVAWLVGWLLGWLVGCLLGGFVGWLLVWWLYGWLHETRNAWHAGVVAHAQCGFIACASGLLC